MKDDPTPDFWWEGASHMATAIGLIIALVVGAAAAFVGIWQANSARGQLTEMKNQTALANKEAAIARAGAEQNKVDAERDKRDNHEVAILNRLLDSLIPDAQGKVHLGQTIHFDLVCRLSADALPFWRGWLKYAGPLGADRQPWNPAGPEVRSLLATAGAPDGFTTPVDRVAWQMRRDCYLAIAKRTGQNAVEMDSFLLALHGVNLDKEPAFKLIIHPPDGPPRD